MRARTLAAQDASTTSIERAPLVESDDPGSSSSWHRSPELSPKATRGSLGRVRLRVEGMTCGACAGAVESALLAAPGVKRAAVSLTTGDAVVELQAGATVVPEDLAREVEDAGFEATIVRDAERSSVKLLVDGMTCAACTGAVERASRAVSGVEDVTVSLLPEGSAEVRFDPDATGPRAFVDAIDDAGFDAHVSSSDGAGARRGRSATASEAETYKSLFWTSLSYTVPTFAINMILPHVFGFSWLYVDVVNKVKLASFVKWALATPVQFVVGRRFHVGAYKSLKNGAANMDVLVSLGTNVAYFTSIYLIFHCVATGHNFGRDMFETSTMLITFILLGKYLESIAKGQTSDAISKLMDLTPNTATLLKPLDGTDPDNPEYAEETISSTMIHRGDLLRVMPGSRVAADGVVVEGDDAHVDESMITGEALPVLKRVADGVVGGTLNAGRAFVMRARSASARTRRCRRSSSSWRTRSSPRRRSRRSRIESPAYSCPSSSSRRRRRGSRGTPRARRGITPTRGFPMGRRR